MARKVRKSGSKNKASGHTSYRDRAAKDEKARYERCRRRRLGLVKKLAEFHTLFDTEVQCLFRSKTDKRQVYWFSSEDDWRDQAPQTTPGAIRLSGPGHRRSKRHDLIAPETNYDSDSENSDFQDIQGASTEFATSLSGLRMAFKTLFDIFDKAHVMEPDDSCGG
ncbi:hypothetical protein H2198_007231 [Neophaeococcomyces mojaviensis]|uniref:Uncharacterized protein n=1 Tax=Neophaeococcomyces mojaviensis TaxID=3383035 RepID=A0ACC3A0R4_9EURO|nr:hypothetical protein H2198_007231 [Knufia sp. JES_112]